jgi:hypothetical protein
MFAKLSEDEVKAALEAEGYRLLSKYHSGHSKIDIECPEKHTYKATFLKFKHSGRRCPYCAGQIVTHEDAKNLIESCGYTLLDAEYRGALDPMRAICDKGHQCLVRYSYFKTGRRCFQCAVEGRSRENAQNWVEDRRKIIAAKRRLSKEYKLRKRQSVPQWMEESIIQELYELALKRSEETGIAHHVDHIDPLKSTLVCGLHCAANLQVVPASRNMKKHNSFHPYTLGDQEFPSCPIV